MKICKSEGITWYEDASILEWWTSEDPTSKETRFCTIEDAIELAQKECILLVIQPMYQDECIFIDYSK